MPATFEIRAAFDSESITVYQAFNHAIADAALEAGTFMAPFSMNRMTWIKPSFLWLMERSNWAQKSGQERVLAVRIRRTGWDEVLALGTLTHPEPKIWPDADAWRLALSSSPVHVQWDPERSIRGQAQSHYSIQVGLSRAIIERYVNEWILEISDVTPTVRKINALIQSGRADRAKELLPRERVYFVAPETARMLGMAVSTPAKDRRRS